MVLFIYSGWRFLVRFFLLDGDADHMSIPHSLCELGTGSNSRKSTGRVSVHLDARHSVFLVVLEPR